MHQKLRILSLMLAALTGVLGVSVLHAETPAAASGGAALGKAAPDFSLTDTDGKTVTLSSLRGKTVVLEWFNPDCPFIKHAHTKGPLKDLAKRTANDKLVWLAINSNAKDKQGYGVERNRQAKTEYGIPHPILLDESGKVGHAYGAIKTPHMFVIDPKGVLVYRGGVDNAPIGSVDAERPHLPGNAKDTLENYLEYALADLAAKKPLRLADTPPYGCTVKYHDK
jgi:peroxiredoxin